MTNDHTTTIQIPRWRYVAETGHGYDELTPEEKRLAWEYLTTDTTPEVHAMLRAAGEKLGQQARERIDAAVMKLLTGETNA